MKEIILKYLLKSEARIVAIIFGVVLLIIPFTEFDGKSYVPKFPKEPTGYTWFLFGSGCLMLIGAGLSAIFELRLSQIRKTDISKGFELAFHNLKISIIVGKLDEIASTTKDSGIVLPTNTSFIDGCITDGKSALGSYFLKFHPNRISEFTKDVTDLLKTENKDANGYYLPATTVILPSAYNIPARCIITASTVKQEKTDLQTEPGTISNCIRHVFEKATSNRIDTLYMPVLGSGRGGVPINDALIQQILSLKFYAKKFHSIKHVIIFIIPGNVQQLNINFLTFKNLPV